jgi:all-trans-8'-apo-beta-carotenal 15,15'-oxygenase
MNRREFVRAFVQTSTAMASLQALPSRAQTGAASTAADFDANALKHPSLTPYKGVSDAAGVGAGDLRCESLAVTGRWPAELNGRFYRNGPALFERGGQRYQHWFDGDGMVQQFTFNGGKVAHRGALVRTHKLLTEQKAGKFVYSAFGSYIPSDVPLQGPDSLNPANTSVIEHAGRLMALWEGGSACELNASDLSTRGPVVWKAGLEQVPFSAHPKRDADGHLWNIGSFGNRLIAWHIDPQGKLVDAKIGASPYAGGMVHDMAITDQYLVVPLPPVKLNFDALRSGGAEQAFAMDAKEPLRILVMRKDDLSQRRVFELPAQMVFHVGNAFERADGNVSLSFVGSPHTKFLRQGAVAVMRGEPSQAGSASTQLVELNLSTGRATLTTMDDRVEFPQVDPRRVGQAAQHLLSTSSWMGYAGREGSYHGVQMRDVVGGKLKRFDYGENMVVEEHLMVPKLGRAGELDAWLIGTSFDVKRQITVLNVLDAARIEDGPVAQAALPYKLPFGFHGHFAQG